MTIFQNIINVTTIEKEQPDDTTSKQKMGRMAVGRMAIGKEEPEAALLKGTVSTSYAKLCMRNSLRTCNCNIINLVQFFVCRAFRHRYEISGQAGG